MIPLQPGKPVLHLQRAETRDQLGSHLGCWQLMEGIRGPTNLLCHSHVQDDEVMVLSATSTI